MQKTKCLICRKEFEWNDSMYRFCDDCLDVIDTLGVDWNEAEKKLMLWRHNKELKKEKDNP